MRTILYLISILFSKNKKNNQQKTYLTLDNYFMGRDKTFKNELTEDVMKNAIFLLQQVNNLLNDLNYLDKYTISSGWRPPSLNSKIKNAAKRSLHMQGLAIDVVDNENQDLCKKIAEKHQLLKKHGLWMEDMLATKGWCHLDSSNVRADRPIRIFKP